MEPPTFLTDEEKKTRELNRRGDKQESPLEINSKVWSPEIPREPRPREPETQESPRELRPQESEIQGSPKTQLKVSVKSRIQEINNKSASPGKFPELKQTKLMQ